MLSPKRVRHRKQMKQVRQLRGTETRGTKLVFGDYGMVINEAGWMYMNYQQLELVRHRLSLSLRDLLHHRSQAEAAKQWDRMSILDPQFNIIVSKISWVNGTLRDRRQ